MNSNLQFDFIVNKENNTVNVHREFAADLDLVWMAWTTPEILDQWWAPKPFRTETISMDFKVGGSWLYCMISPTNERHWCRADYHSIEPKKSYTGLDAFTDENGTINDSFPRALWNTSFMQKGEHTMVEIIATYNSLEDLETIIKLGFKEGFTMAMENLDQYIQAQQKLRTQLKTDRKARVNSYLNFPGNTEEAFTFYKNVFKSEFNGGMQRFGDIPASPENPPIDDSVKKMILHVELPITGGYVLMGTDAPKEMGFNCTSGNNMHISIEPETKEEATRLFNELSAEGQITMPLQDMFWGAYYGSFTDKFGINWMINYLN